MAGAFYKSLNTKDAWSVRRKGRMRVGVQKKDPTQAESKSKDLTKFNEYSTEEIRSKKINSNNKYVQLHSELKLKNFWVNFHNDKRIISWPGGQIHLQVSDLADSQQSSSKKIKSLQITMPGKVVAIKVKVGEKVAAGNCLAIVEAMKMENQLLAETDVEVESIKVSKGDALEAGATLMTFKQ